MNKKNPTAASTSGASKTTNVRRRANIQMLQNVLLIWLDNNINDSSFDCRNTITQLRRVVNIINTFTDGDQCIDFLTDIYDQKVVMIISGALCQNIVPLIHDVSNLHTMFIHCQNKKQHEQWAKEWPKIKGVFTEILPICEGLKQAVQQCEQNAIPINFMVTSGDISTKKLDQLDCSFMWTQILKEILLTIKFEEKHIQEFIQHCCERSADNEYDLNEIKELEQKYRDKTPIWLYTNECFLYSMLNW